MRIELHYATENNVCWKIRKSVFPLIYKALSPLLHKKTTNTLIITDMTSGVAIETSICKYNAVRLRIGHFFFL